MAVKKTIAVLDPNNIYLSHCTWNRALSLLESGRAVRLNATTVRLKQTKKERIRKKHSIIAEAKRICYICNTKIPDDETATVDHIIPKSRNTQADTYDNMRCCCSKCNNDKGNMTLSEYVQHIFENRISYDHISDKRLEYLKNYAKFYEKEFYSKKRPTDIKPLYKSSKKRRKRK
jgi:5-methylcytosine-specific restriction endonuclease McrA